jgi:hypothetical protein
MMMNRETNPYIMAAAESNKLLRLDKNIANSIDQIIDLRGILFGKNVSHDDLHMSGEDKRLINSLIFYFCFTNQHDIFGYGKLDPQKFAEFAKYEPGHLRKKHPNPVQLRGLTEEQKNELYRQQEENPENRVYDSYLENALYVLHHTTLSFRESAKEVIQDGDSVKYVIMSETYTLLPQLTTSLVFKKNSGSPKVTYTYTLNQKFRDNLSLFFMRFEHSSIFKLRRSGLDHLYVYLKNMKDTFIEKSKRNEEIDRSLNFNQMCEMAGVPRYNKEGEMFKNPRDIKYKLNKVFEKLNTDTDLKFSIKWSKAGKNAKGNYVPNICFEEEKEKTHHMYLSSVRHHERKLIFRQNLLLELLEYFKRHNAERDNLEENTLLWLRKDKDQSSKELAFRNAQFKTYGRVHKNIDKMVSDWMKTLSNLNRIDDLLIGVSIDNKEEEKS